MFHVKHSEKHRKALLQLTSARRHRVNKRLLLSASKPTYSTHRHVTLSYTLWSDTLSHCPYTEKYIGLLSHTPRTSCANCPHGFRRSATPCRYVCTYAIVKEHPLAVMHVGDCWDSPHTTHTLQSESPDLSRSSIPYPFPSPHLFTCSPYTLNIPLCSSHVNHVYIRYNITRGVGSKPTTVCSTSSPICASEACNPPSPSPPLLYPST